MSQVCMNLRGNPLKGEIRVILLGETEQIVLLGIEQAMQLGA